MITVRDMDLCILFQFVQLRLSTLRKKHYSGAAFGEDGGGHRGSRRVSPTPLFETERHCSSLTEHGICAKLLHVFSQARSLCVRDREASKLPPSELQPGCLLALAG